MSSCQLFSGAEGSQARQHVFHQAHGGDGTGGEHHGVDHGLFLALEEQIRVQAAQKGIADDEQEEQE